MEVGLIALAATRNPGPCHAEAGSPARETRTRVDHRRLLLLDSWLQCKAWYGSDPHEGPEKRNLTPTHDSRRSATSRCSLRANSSAGMTPSSFSLRERTATVPAVCSFSPMTSM